MAWANTQEVASFIHLLRALQAWAYPMPTGEGPQLPSSLYNRVPRHGRRRHVWIALFALQILQLWFPHCLLPVQGRAGGTCDEQEGASACQETPTLSPPRTFGPVGAPSGQGHRPTDPS
eukprot:1756879-Amphidinium_carterae.1